MSGTGAIGPLTTPFVMAEACESQLESVYKVMTPSGYELQQGPLGFSSCYPAGYSPSSKAYYSPGVCPSGFTPACSATNSIGSVTETIYTCCPTQYDYQCMTSPTYVWQSTLGCTLPVTHGMNTTYYSLHVTNSSDPLYLTTSVADFMGGINAFAVQVRFQATDGVSSSSSSTTGNAAVPTASDSNSSEASDGSSGLTTGAVAGIGVAVGLVSLGIVGSLVFFFRRRRKVAKDLLPSEMGGPSINPSSSPRFEADSKSPPTELLGCIPPEQGPFEIPGSQGDERPSPSRVR
ncbi:hypothetical protein F5Y15DRAFT_60683 [Xylariaceae sp. FL0016]|nr:hypothetical protein F5Y15DRAFT_60683 [Xylariaceae sp. FL0016]